MAHSNHVTYLFLLLSTNVFLLALVASETFQPSNDVNKEIALNSNISVNSQCSTCNQTCPYRDDFPPFEDVLANKGENCSGVVSDLPPTANRAAETVDFNDTSDCSSVESSVTPGDQGTYSISFWVQGNCPDKCQVLQYGSLTLNLASTQLELSASSDVAKLTENLSPSSKWTHITLGHDGSSIQWFVDGDFVDEAPLGTQTSNLTIGGDLMAGNSLALADVRFYGDILTNREIKAVNKGTKQLDPLPVESKCRCPAQAPRIQAGSVDMCTTQYGTSPMRRLNIDGGYLAYMNDNDSTTCWKSNNTMNTVSVIIPLENVFQIAGLTVHGLNAATETLVVQLEYAGKVIQTLTFQKSPCGTEPNCQPIGHIDGTEFNLNYSSISGRQNLEAFLADTVKLIMSSSSSTEFSICEVGIHVRCHCWGNDASCVVNQIDYTCACSHNTAGENCQNCSQEFYRQADEFSCPHSCNCNNSGSEDNNCNEIGGQCTCKGNVNTSAGRTCDECNFNTVNFGSNATYGCTACDCIAEGIQYCDDNETCVCKNNTETQSGRCEGCLPSHYGLDRRDGCQPCDCHAPGTSYNQSDQCNETTGDCPCKVNVMGRRCDTCRDEWYNLRQDSPTGCEDKCGCSFVGSIRTDRCDIRTGDCVCMGGHQHNRQCTPQITSVSPTYGPKAGGTIITVTGVLLGNQSTSVMSFSIGGTLQEILSWSSTLVTVKTGQVGGPDILSQSIVWSKGSESHRPKGIVMFEYKDNPELLSQQSFVTYTSGRCQLKVKGSNMNSTETPKIVVHTGSINITEDCHPMSDGEMLCPTPDLSRYNITGDTRFGFMFDGFQKFEVLDMDTGVLMVTKDPVVTEFTDSFGNTFNTEIQIKGERLNSACVGELRVFIGEEVCDITSISDDTIVCEPKDSFPGTSRNEKLVLIFGDLRLEPGSITFKDFWNTKPFVYIIVGLGCFVLIVFVILVLCCVRRRRDKTKRESINMDLIKQPRRQENAYVGLDGVVNIIPDDPNDNMSKKADTFLERLHDDARKTLKLSLVQISNIKPGHVCTQKGRLVRIINGTFSSDSGRPGEKLTIKTNIASYPENGEVPDWLEKGLLESTRMRDQIHENVLASCGIAIDAKHVYVLYPEMSNRTLKDHLTAAPEPFTEEKRLDISVQVSEGMNFLDGHHIVHKDLAARNCWVNSEGIVKIADASFTADLYPDEYLIKDGLTMPVRWMAPESLRQAGFYHSKSDVWSFGVLMWEVFTNGFVPYYDITNNADIADFVCNQRYQLGIPHDCSDKIFSVIQLCLSEHSADRPNFFLVTNHLTEIISPQSPVSYVNSEGLQDDIYQNTQIGPTSQPTGPPRIPPKSRRK